MELNAQDIQEALVFDGLDDFTVERGGDDPKALAELFCLLMMGGKNEGMVLTVPADLFLEPSLLGKLDLVGDETRESLLGKELIIRIGMPEEGTESDSVLDRGSAIDLGPNVLSQCPPGPDIQALAAQAETQNGQVRPT